MHTIYNLVTGPLLWLTVIIFFGGCAYKLFAMAKLAKQKDNVVFDYMHPYYALRSIMHWLVPFASENMKKHPILTIVSFIFHICILIAPLFLFAHIVLLKEYINISWVSIPDYLADIMTILVIFACLFFVIRRLVLPEVRFLSDSSDFLILLMVAAPFITGFWAYHQFPGYQTMTILHMLSGEIVLISIPFTRLSHMIFFVFTRAYMGSEFGAVRKTKDW